MKNGSETAKQLIMSLERDERICEVMMLLSVVTGIIVLIIGG